MSFRYLVLLFFTYSVIQCRFVFILLRSWLFFDPLPESFSPFREISSPPSPPPSLLAPPCPTKTPHSFPDLHLYEFQLTVSFFSLFAAIRPGPFGTTFSCVFSLACSHGCPFRLTSEGCKRLCLGPPSFYSFPALVSPVMVRVPAGPFSLSLLYHSIDLTLFPPADDFVSAPFVSGLS